LQAQIFLTIHQAMFPAKNKTCKKKGSLPLEQVIKMQEISNKKRARLNFSLQKGFFIKLNKQNP